MDKDLKLCELISDLYKIGFKLNDTILDKYTTKSIFRAARSALTQFYGFQIADDVDDYIMSTHDGYNSAEEIANLIDSMEVDREFGHLATKIATKKRASSGRYESLLNDWEIVAGDKFNEAYEIGGMSKKEIEESESDSEYEMNVVQCVIDAWNNWVEDVGPTDDDYFFNALTGDMKVKVVQWALNSENAKYGWYRGSLDNPETVKSTLKNFDM